MKVYMEVIKMSDRMRCLVDGFFWCPLSKEDNFDGKFCWQCNFDPQKKRVEMRYGKNAKTKGNTF